MHYACASRRTGLYAPQICFLCSCDTTPTAVETPAASGLGVVSRQFSINRPSTVRPRVVTQSKCAAF